MRRTIDQASRPSSAIHPWATNDEVEDFDVSRAEATDPEDRSRLLGVIEGSGTGIRAFNEWVRTTRLRASSQFLLPASGSLTGPRQASSAVGALLRVSAQFSQPQARLSGDSTHSFQWTPKAMSRPRATTTSSGGSPPGRGNRCST
jgi:hypothetical protein